MSIVEWFAAVEMMVGFIMAWRSRYGYSGLTLILWAVHLALALAIVHYPGRGAWAGIVVGAASGKMLALAATALALLLFTANFFHGVAKPEKEPETYYGVVLDTYLSVRSRFTSILLTESFHLFAVALFVLPLVLPAVPTDHPRIVTVIAAAWCSCLGLVYGVLLLNAVSVLRVSLRRLVGRDSIRYLIGRDIKNSFRHQFLQLVRSRDSGAVEEHGNMLMTAMARMPAQQQTSYLRATLGSYECSRIIDNQLQRAHALNSEAGTVSRAVMWARECARGNTGWPEDQAMEIVRTVEHAERGRATTIATNWNAFTDQDVREHLLTTLTSIGTTTDERFDKLEPVLQDCGWWEGRECSLLRQDVWQSYRNGPDPKLLRTTMACLGQVIEFRFPSGKPSQCPAGSLQELASDIQRLRHERTRVALLNLFARRTVASTITQRANEETLPIDILRNTFQPRTRRDTPFDDEMTKVLNAAAMRASLDYHAIAEEGLDELLKLLDVNQAAASLIYLLQYSHRGHDNIEAAQLRPYYKCFAYRGVGDTIEDVELDKVYEFLCNSNISHFTGKVDIKWLLESVQKPVDANFIRDHERHLAGPDSGDFPLSTALLWRGTVADIGYAWDDATLPDDTATYRRERLADTLRRAAAVLDDIKQDRGQRLLINNPWIRVPETTDSPDSWTQ